MDKSKNFEKNLPENYVLAKHVNAKNDKKQVIIYSLLSFVPVIIIVPVLIIIAKYTSGSILKDDNFIYTLIALAVAYFIWVVYIVLHEITHGITYKCFTGEKLKYGFTITVAFCGVPDIYVRRKASIAALVMPFSVFSVVFIGLTVGLWFVSPFYGILAGGIFSVHLGGCVGDLHWTLMYLTKFRHCNTLMRDTGPEQWVYIPEDEAKKYGFTPIALEEPEEKTLTTEV